MADTLSPNTAVADILWLQARFKGILDLAAKLEDIANLENYSTELAASTQSLKAENAKLVSVKLDLEASVKAAKEEAGSVVAAANTKAAAILADAKAEADAYRTSARDATASEVMELQTQKQLKLKEVAELTNKAKDVAVCIEEQQKVYDNLVSMINELKAKF